MGGTIGEGRREVDEWQREGGEELCNAMSWRRTSDGGDEVVGKGSHEESAEWERTPPSVLPGLPSFPSH